MTDMEQVVHLCPGDETVEIVRKRGVVTTDEPLLACANQSKASVGSSGSIRLLGGRSLAPVTLCRSMVTGLHRRCNLSRSRALRQVVFFDRTSTTVAAWGYFWDPLFGSGDPHWATGAKVFPSCHDLGLSIYTLHFVMVPCGSPMESPCDRSRLQK